MNNFKYCGNCGKKIRSNTKFCPYCGAKQSNDARMNTQPTYKMPTRHRKWINSGKHKLILLVIIIIIVILGFVGYQHSEASINLNREIPNNTWKFRGNSDGSIGKVNDVHFKNSYMVGHSLNNQITKGDLDHMTIKPTGRHTANLDFHDFNNHGSIMMKVTKGNEHTFKLSSIHKSKGYYDGYHTTVTNNKEYLSGKNINRKTFHTNKSTRKFLNISITLTKE